MKTIAYRCERAIYWISVGYPLIVFAPIALAHFGGGR